ncbi:hypothetical protein C8J56DRAFT_1043586 [Mycena floridula]|nr:hypothetical protein C8J56DRAFT_1043586 [Mycena floridula]
MKPQSVSEICETARAKFQESIDTLECTDIWEFIPQIFVIGEQGVGKTGVVEALSGVDKSLLSDGITLPSPTRFIGLPVNAGLQDIRSVKDTISPDMGRNSEDLILLVLDMSVDIEAQTVLSLAKEIDPTGALTIAVLTNPDFSGATPTTLQKWMDVLNGVTVPFENIDYFVVMTTEGISEADFFAKTAPFAESALSDQFTVAKLRREVERRLIALISAKNRRLRLKIQQRLAEVRREFSTIPYTGEEQQVVLSIAQLCDAANLSMVEGKYLAVAEEFVAGIKQTAPNFVPSDSPGSPLIIVDENESRHCQSTSLAMNLRDLQQYLKNLQLPGEIRLEDKHELITRFQAQWPSLVQECLKGHESAVLISLIGLISTLFPKHKQLRWAMVPAVISLIHKHHDICQELLRTIVKAKETPATRSVRDYQEVTRRWFAKYQASAAGSLHSSIQEEYQREFKVMAEVRGYFHIVHQRLIDEVLELIELKFLKAISKDLQSFLLDELQVNSDDPESQAICAGYGVEDAVFARREELLSREKKLLQAQASLDIPTSQ